MEVCQFITKTFQERGGGERVMEAIYKTLKAKVYTFNKRLHGEEIEEVGNNITRTAAGATVKL